MKQITNVALNLSFDNDIVVFAKQFDKNSRFLHIQLYDNNNIFTLENDFKPIIIIHKPDDTEIINSCKVIEDNTIEVELTYQMLIAEGVSKAEIILYDYNSDIITSSAFFINVKSSLYDNGTVESSSEYNALIDALSITSSLGDGISNLDEKIMNINDISKQNKNSINSINDMLSEIENNKVSKIDLGNISSGTPLVAKNINDMTDTSRMYVNVSDGMIYAYLNSKWQSTKIKYQSTGISEKSIDKSKLTNDIIECQALMPIKNYCNTFNSSIANSTEIYNYNKTGSTFSRYNDSNDIGHFTVTKTNTNTEYSPYFGIYDSNRFIPFTKEMIMYVSVDITGDVVAKLQFRYCDKNKANLCSTQARDISSSGELSITVPDIYKNDCAYIEITAVMLNSTTKSGSIDMYNFKAYILDDMLNKPNLAETIDIIKTNIDSISNKSNQVDKGIANRNLHVCNSAYSDSGEIVYLFDGSISSMSNYTISDNCYINTKSLMTKGRYSQTYIANIDDNVVSTEDYIGIYVNVSREDISKVKTLNISFRNSDNNDIAKTELGSWNLQNGWYLYKCKPLLEGTISQIVISIYSDEEITIYFDSVIKNRKLKTKLMLCFDNWGESLINAYNLLSKYGFKGTFCITNNHTHKTFEDLYNILINGGWDVAYYNGYGDRPEDSNSQAEWDTFICTAMNNLIYSGCQKPTAYFCRWNKSTNKIINACKKADFKLIRMSHSNYYIDEFNYDSFETPCTQILNNNLEAIKSYIDNAIERGASISIFAHQVLSDSESGADDTVNVNVSTYTDLLEYVQSKAQAFELEVTTYKDFYNSVIR